MCEGGGGWGLLMGVNGCTVGIISVFANLGEP